MKTLTLSILLACASSQYCEPVSAEIITLDNFKCGTQSVSVLPTPSNKVSQTDFVATSCTNNAINTKNVKRQMGILSFAPFRTTFAADPRTGSMSDIGEYAGECRLNYVFDAQALTATSSIKIIITNPPNTAETVGVKLWNTAGGSSHIYAYGPTTAIFPLAKITKSTINGLISYPAVTTLGSLSITTSCKSAIKSVVLDR